MLSVQEGDYLLFANVGDTFFVAKKPQNFFGVKLTKSQSPKSRSLECTIKAVIKTGLIPGYYELSSQFTQKEEDTHGKEVDVTWFKMTKLDDK